MPIRIPLPRASNRRSVEFCFPQEARRLLGRDGIDVEPRAPLKAGDTSQARNDLDMPVIMRQRLGIEWRCMDDEVISGSIEGELQFSQHRFEYDAKLIDLRFMDVFKMTAVEF